MPRLAWHTARPRGRLVNAIYLLEGAMAIGALILAPSSARPQMNLATVGFMSVLAGISAAPTVSLGTGVLNLSAIALQASTILMSPQLAAVPAVSCAVVRRIVSRRGAPRLQVLAMLFWTVGASSAHSVALELTHSAVASAIVAVVIYSGLNIGTTALAGSVYGHAKLHQIVRAAADGQLAALYIYFGIASTLIASLIDGSLRGYAEATAAFSLCIALTGFVAANRSSHLLQHQLIAADDHVIISQALPGLIHNLRNQIALIRAHLSDLQEGTASGAPYAMLRAANDDALALIAALESGSRRAAAMPISTTNLSELVQFSVSIAEATARERNVTMTTNAPNHRVDVLCNPLMVREVINNLLLNAIAFGPSKSGVSVSVSSSNGSGMVSISDRGPGIHPDDLAHLFRKRFSRRRDGAGLGLLVSKELMVTQGGDLTYEGGPDGAIFMMRLPLAVISTAAPRRP